MWAAVFAVAPSTVTLRIGSSQQTFNVGSGVTKLKIPTAPGRIYVKMARGGVTMVEKEDMNFEFTDRPVRCESMVVPNLHPEVGS